MTTIASIIQDYFPGNNDVGVPLGMTIWVLFDREMNETKLAEDFFVEGPDTDTYVGPDIDLQVYPNNISQGDDFLESPGYKGIVKGKITFKKISPTNPDVEVDTAPYITKLIFTPDHPMAALTQYTAHIPEAYDTEDTAYTGHYTFSWTTGTGSIQALPTATSTSILVPGSLALGAVSSKPMVAKNFPKENAVEVSPTLREIVIEYDKELDPTSVNEDMISVFTMPVSDHPDLKTTALGELAKSITVEGKKLVIKI